MMKIVFYLLSFVLLSCLGEQPYFPSQIVFSPNNGVTTIAIDKPNERASNSIALNSFVSEKSYVYQHFPYTIPDSPESKYYVQLLVDFPPLSCMYGTYWRYGGYTYNSFPSHWSNGTSFEIKNYIEFKYEMIHSTNSSEDEDYWYANETCRVDSGQSYPCEEIYFKKNTDIPLRSTRVIRGGWAVIQVTTNYKIISMGKPDEKYFDSIPEDWPLSCRDVMLGVLYYPQTSKIDLNQSVKVQISLTAPPHRINGNDTVHIQWKTSEWFTWTPKQLSFNSEDFQEKQTLTITRVKNGSKATLIPIFNGGGFDLVTSEDYPIYIE